MGRGACTLVFVIPAGVCGLWTIVAGKDVNWDLLNYHYYLPFEFLAGRLGQDFFAASAQGYLNPVGYLPFYLMVSAGWHSVIVSIVLAAAHSLSIALLFLISWRLFAHRVARERILWSAFGAVLGVATPVFWATVGTSFLDPLVLPLMLAGLLLLLDTGRSDLVWRMALAGALFGAAGALKYSNAIYILAALPFAVSAPAGPGGLRWRARAAYLAGAAAAIAVLAGPWLFLMQREFGNPVFPLFNAWFKSPHAPAINPVSVRFALAGWLDGLAFPFRIVALNRSLYSEIFAPDLRPAAVLVLAAGVALGASLRRLPGSSALRGVDWRVLGFLGLASLLWLGSSANARYGLIVLCLSGVCLARLAERVLPARAARIGLAVLLAVQLGVQIAAAPARWFIAEPWSKRWLPYDVPQRALREPYLYLTVEVLPMAVVAPFVHSGSAFVNFRGQHSLPSDSPRLRELLERYRGRVRALGRGLELIDGRPKEDQVRAYDATLQRIGYRLDTADCFTIGWRPREDDWLSRGANWLAGPQLPHESLSVTSCALRPAPREPSETERERRASVIFDRIERSCPRLFRGQTAVTEPLGMGWSRNYSDLDARLQIEGKRAILNLHRRGTYVDLGPLSAWQRDDGPRPASCERPRR